MIRRRNVPEYVFGAGAIEALPGVINQRRLSSGIEPFALFVVDSFFAGGKSPTIDWGRKWNDMVHYVDSEPTVDDIDNLTKNTWENGNPFCIVGIGGGSTMDTAKAVSIMLTNKRKAEDYQGWDKPQNPSIYKIGVPTISGTGSETSRTCVLTNKAKGLKLGINSDYSMFDALVLDPDLTKTVPKEQRFYTAMDTFFHCEEYLEGRDRNRFQDAFAYQASDLLRYKSLRDSDLESRESLMVASFMGGVVAGTTGLVHPFSAGLSTVLGLSHGYANCVAANGVREYYSKYRFNWALDLAYHDAGMKVSFGEASGLTDDQYEQLYQSTTEHEKPLANHLGPDWRSMLTKDRVQEIFKRM